MMHMIEKNRKIFLFKSFIPPLITQFNEGHDRESQFNQKQEYYTNMISQLEQQLSQIQEENVQLHLRLSKSQQYHDQCNEYMNRIEQENDQLKVQLAAVYEKKESINYSNESSSEGNWIQNTKERH